MPSADVLAPLLFLAAGLLAWAGATKVVRPGQTVRALRAAGLPFVAPVVRGFGLLELMVGIACLLAPGPVPAAGLAALYAVFAAFVLRLVARGVPIWSCGCLGRLETPPSLLHATLDVSFAAVGLLAAGATVPALQSFVRDRPGTGVTLLIGLAAAGWLFSLTIAYVPRLFLSYRHAGRR